MCSEQTIQLDWNSKLFYGSRFTKDFNTISVLGQGSFGHVFKAHRISVNKDYAVKVIKLPASDEEVKKFRREANILAQLEHANIVRYYTNWTEDIGTNSEASESGPPSTEASQSNGASDIVFQSKFQDSCAISGTDKLFVTKSSNDHDTDDGTGDVSWTFPNELDSPGSFLFIEMELCDRTLRDYIDELNGRESTRISLRSKLAAIIIQITVAIKFIHINNIIHRDLKPTNIFMVYRGNQNQNLVKIGDFGVACIAQPSKRLEVYQTHGTHFYVAPEMEKGSSYDSKIDVYSVGVILFELMCKMNTQSERADLLSRVSNGVFPVEFLKEFPDEKEQIQKMLHKDPFDRQSSRQVHVWAKKYRDRFKST